MMGIKVFKSTTSARNIQYQDSLLASVVPEFPNVPTFFDSDRISMFRRTQRKTKDDVYVASLAILADSEVELVAMVGAAKLRGSTIHCIEEGITLDKIKAPELKRLWKDARRAGSAMRGARASADTKKAKTAEAMKLIDRDLKTTDIPTKELLARVGIKSINTIRNHYGFSREEMQRKYQAELKRKSRRKNA